MISKKNRFYGLGSLNFVFRRGSSLRNSFLSVKYIKNKRNENYRLAVVVSKKVTKIAPKRNKIRRRIYEVLRIEAPHYLTNQDVVFTVYDEKILDLSHPELVDLIKKQLQKITED